MKQSRTDYQQINNQEPITSKSTIKNRLPANETHTKKRQITEYIKTKNTECWLATALKKAYMVGESEGTAARAASFSEDAMEMERDWEMWELRTVSRVQCFISSFTITALILFNLPAKSALFTCHVESASFSFSDQSKAATWAFNFKLIFFFLFKEFNTKLINFIMVSKKWQQRKVKNKHIRIESHQKV